MKRVRLSHEFVDYIPASLQPRVIYISVAYATAVHVCVCGCGHKVVTPLSPTDWNLIFDGETISLDPSIGNWNFPCQSHYWIRRNVAIWAPRWSQLEIDAGRASDQKGKRRFSREDGGQGRESKEPESNQGRFWEEARKRFTRRRK